MCGRYTLKKDIQVNKMHGISIKRSYNISPGSTVDLLASDHMRLKWSYSPPWAKSHMNLINARYETIHEKPSFKDAKRCVFIADGWYEWNRFFDYKKRENVKQAYYHHLDGDIFYMAGLHNAKGCCIVTKEASEKFKDIHHRQPFLLTDEQISDWLSGEPFIKDRCSSLIIIDKVSSLVNTPKNNSPECIEPI